MSFSGGSPVAGSSHGWRLQRKPSALPMKYRFAWTKSDMLMKGGRGTRVRLVARSIPRTLQASSVRPSREIPASSVQSGYAVRRVRSPVARSIFHVSGCTSYRKPSTSAERPPSAKPLNS
jgi:hypothetical protein